MRTPKYIEVNCARCHSDIYDIKDAAPTLYEGRYLFANLGCANCHQIIHACPPWLAPESGARPSRTGPGHSYSK